MRRYTLHLMICAAVLVGCDRSELSITETENFSSSDSAVGAKPICPGDPRCKDDNAGALRVVILKPLSGWTQSKAYAINESYQVVGESFTRSGGKHATLWTITNSGAVLSITDLQGPDHESSEAASINNYGVVVGRGWGASGSRAFVWTRENGMRTLTLPTTTCTSNATDINDAGEIIGMVNCGSGPHVYRWTVNSYGYESAAPVEFGSIAGVGYAISSDGSFAGAGRDLGGFVSTRSGVVTLIQDAGEALGLSDSGVVVGWTKSFVAFYWTQAGGLRTLSSLGGDGLARGVNQANMIVGGSSIGVQRKPVLWANDVITTLPLPGKKYNGGEAWSINQDGAIAGWVDSPNATYAALWIR